MWSHWAIPFSTSSVYGDKLSYCSCCAKGCIVNGDLCACCKWCLQCSMSFVSIWVCLSIVVHLLASVGCGIMRWLSPLGLCGFRMAFTVVKHLWFISAICSGWISFFLVWSLVGCFCCILQWLEEFFPFCNGLFANSVQLLLGLFELGCNWSCGIGWGC